MLSRLANIFRVPDLRNKVIFTLAIVALYQIGANVPVPGVNWSRLQSLESSASSSGVLAFLNLFRGGALARPPLQSSGLIYAFHGHDAALLGTNIDLIPRFSLGLAAFMVMCLTAGTAFVMWLAELITQRGIGQGMATLIFPTGVAAIP